MSVLLYREANGVDRVALLSTIVSPTVNECALLSRPPWLDTSDVLGLQLQRRRPLHAW